jgi:hypothetical protein
MNGLTIDPNGVHVIGNHNNFDLNSNYLYSFDGKIYEYLTYTDTLNSSVQFKFINGNISTQAETVPSSCNVSSYREIVFGRDTVMPAVCFGSCSPCVNGISNSYKNIMGLAVPNPFNSSCIITISNENPGTFRLYNSCGALIKTYEYFSGKFILYREELPAGLYYIINQENESLKLIMQ